MKTPSELTAAELRDELSQHGFKIGPIVDSTRPMLEKKLATFRSGGTAKKSTAGAARNRRPSPRQTPTVQSLSPVHNSTVNSTSSISSPPTHQPPAPRSGSRGRPVPASRPTEPSDNELDASVPMDSPKSTLKRTPTPSRPTVVSPGSANARTQGSPSRSPKIPTYSPRPSTRSNVSPAAPAFGSPQFHSDNDADLFDDQSESSRILSPVERRSPSYRSPGLNSTASTASFPRRRIQPPVAALQKRPQGGDSPMAMLRRAVNYFSRATPKGYERHASERGAYGTPGGRFSPLNRTREFEQETSVGDVPKWIMICVFSFTAILLLAYVSTAYPKTVDRGRRVLTGAVYDTATFIYNYAVFPVFVTLLVAAVGFAAFFVYKNRKITREQFERRTMELVDKIADRVRESGNSGIAEQHIRDSLFPPTRRTEHDWTLWNSAVDFINNMDSRMRSENRVISGVECNVWVWANVHDTSQGYHGIAEHSPQPLRGPDRALTRCLKVRGLIDSNRSEDEIVKHEVYDKLRPVIPVHFAIVRGNEPCVYLMFKELAEAKKAFDAFHTQWIRGNLVSVKYVRDERYSERFPEITM